MCRSDARQPACRLTPPQHTNIVVHLHASSSVVIITATEEITHVDVFLGLLLLGLLLLSSGRVIRSSAAGSSATTAATSADIGQKLGNVLSLEGLGEEAGPVALNGVSASLDDLAEFFFLLAIKKENLADSSCTIRLNAVTYSDVEISVVEEQCSIGANESVLFFGFQF